MEEFIVEVRAHGRAWLIDGGSAGSDLNHLWNIPGIERQLQGCRFTDEHFNLGHSSRLKASLFSFDAVATWSQVVDLEDSIVVGGCDPVDRFLATNGNLCVLHHGSVDIHDRSADGAFCLNILSSGYKRGKAQA